MWPLYIDSLGISSQCKHPDAAWTFLTWFSQVENVLPYLEQIGILSPNRRALYSEYVQKTMKPIQGIYLDFANARRNFFFAGLGQVDAFMRTMITKVINNEMSPEEALDQWEFEWNKARDLFYK